MNDELVTFMLACRATMQIHFITVDIESAATHAPDVDARRATMGLEMPQTVGDISLEHDTPELARAYDEAGLVQFRHGKFLIGPLAIKSGEHVLDIGTGTGRLAEFVAGLVGPDGHVIGIDPLAGRIEIARLRQGDNLQFATGRAEDLSGFDDAQFDAVYLNSVFHWISDKDRALREIRRVLKPSGRLGLNVQDPSRPHQSRLLLRRAIVEAGLAGDRQDSNPVLGSTDEELKSLFAAHGFAGYRSELRALIDIHDDAASLLQWSEASAFGNFLEAFTPHERDLVRRTFARLVEEKRTPEGLKLERYLRFAFAHKAPSHQ
ncbi:class I SAM-dependent methyltransferase [Bradyrhizobium sp. UFLA06-06]